jgi:hypothetical protein
VKGFFSKTQRPEVLQDRSYPRRWYGFVKSETTAIQPMSYPGGGLAEKGRCRLRTVQAAGPALDCGGVGQTIRILELRQRLFPRTVLRKAQPQCLAARQQAVMRVREREHRKEGEGHPAIGTAAAPDPNPVVMLVVGLLAAPTVTNDRIVFTERASAYDGLVAVFRPIGCNLVRRDGNWDKVDRASQGFRHCLRPAKIPAGSGAPPPDEKSN